VDNQAGNRSNNLFFGAVGVIGGVIISVLAMVLSRPIRPAAIEIITPELTAPLMTAEPLPTEEILLTATPGMLNVFVSGAVTVPDVYELPPGSLVKDAIVAAGGFTAEANRDILNQALPVQDGDHIHVPTLMETAETPPPISNEAPASGDATNEEQSGGTGGDLININTATLAELETLPGIGPSLGQNIIDYREANGPFETIEDIMKVSGIGTAKFEAIRDLITVGN
jgi:competence protein ComEA